MRVVYEDGEKERIKNALDAFPDMALFDEQDPDRCYSISFKVTNVSLAQHILMNLLHNKLDDFDLGIDVMSINFAPIQNVDEVKDRLHKLIDEIIN